MEVDYLIVGQGIAGSLLSYELVTAGKKVMVLDQPDACPASLVAGAVINPLSGKNYTPSRDADLFVPAALQAYQALEQLLQAELLQQKELYIFPENEDQAYAIEQARHRESTGKYLRWLENKQYEIWGKYFHARQGIAVLEPVWQVNAALLLQRWRQYLEQHEAYRAETFQHERLDMGSAELHYKDIKAGTIVFCEGASAAANPLFRQLPFTANRGDVLLLSIPGLPATGIYHQGLRMVPRPDGLFWCGSNYRWNFKDLEPDESWRDTAMLQLKQWLKLPFTLEEHIVAARPTTAGQLPLLGFHPDDGRVAIFNGLGTRGFSSGPYWARALCNLLLDKQETIPGYNHAWFAKHFR